MAIMERDGDVSPPLLQDELLGLSTEELETRIEENRQRLANIPMLTQPKPFAHLEDIERHGVISVGVESQDTPEVPDRFRGDMLGPIAVRGPQD